MRVAIFGATGRVGRQLVVKALGGGHDVTAVVRDPTPLDSVVSQNLAVVTVPRLVAEAAERVVAGRDVVFSTIGSRDGRAPTSACRETAACITEAMRRTGTRRLVALSSGVLSDTNDPAWVRGIVKPILRRVLREPLHDLAAMEEHIRSTTLDWTLVRPARLTDAAATGVYRMEPGCNVRGAGHISRALVADCMLRVAADPAAVGVWVGVSE